jgi:hypothetical protein
MTLIRRHCKQTKPTWQSRKRLDCFAIARNDTDSPSLREGEADVAIYKKLDCFAIARNDTESPSLREGEADVTIQKKIGLLRYRSQ